MKGLTRRVAAVTFSALVLLSGACSHKGSPATSSEVAVTLVYTDFPTKLFDCSLQLSPTGGTQGHGAGPVRFSFQDSAGVTTGSATVSELQDGDQYCVGHVTLPIDSSPPFRLVAEGVNNHVVQSGPTFSMQDIEDAEFQISANFTGDFSPPEPG